MPATASRIATAADAGALAETLANGWDDLLELLQAAGASLAGAIALPAAPGIGWAIPAVIVVVLFGPGMTAMGVTAFAAAPAGTYKTTLKSASGVIPPHNNPLPGVSLDYNEADDVTTVTVYADPINFMGITGYVTELTLDGMAFDDSVEGNVTDANGNVIYKDNGQPVTYDQVMVFTLPGEITAPYTFDIEYSVVYVNMGGSHNSTSGTLEVLAEKN